MAYDAILIGGSFAGLSAALQLARARRTVCVIDSGRPRNRFAEAAHGFFGWDGTPPATMIAEARSKLMAYPTVSFVAGEAESAEPLPDGFAVRIAGGPVLTGAKLLLAFGVRDILPDLPGLAERWGRSVLHCPYCHGYEFAGRPLGVLGAGPLSAHHALLIAEWGPTTLFLNGNASPDADALAKLAARGVRVEPEQIAGLEGRGDALLGVRLQDGRKVPAEALYIAPVTRMASPIAEQLGCAFDDGPFGPVLRVDADMMTTVAGVYAAGDIARVPHNATLASADGVLAGTGMHRAMVFAPLAA